MRVGVSHPIEHLDLLASRTVDVDVAPEQTELWVSSESVLIFELELPKVSLRKQQEMLPWMLEDKLLSSPEDFEFCIGPETDSGHIVYAVSRANLSQWVMVAQAAAVSPDSMAPDFFALPYEDGRWAVYADQGRLLVRTGLYTGFAADLSFGWQQLQLLLEQEEQAPRLSFLQSSAVEVPSFFEDKLDTQTGQINWSFSELPQGINLLPKNMKPKKASGSGLVWWPVAASMAVFFLTAVAYMLVQSWAWQRDITTLEAGIASAYEDIFKEDFRGRPEEVMFYGEQKMSLLEHQYIVMQSSPMVALGALDRPLSGCTDCSIIGLKQIDGGLQFELKETSAVKSRFAGLSEWDFSWSPSSTEGYSLLTVEPAR